MGGRLGGKERKFNPGSESSADKNPATPRTVLPPSMDRESMALDAVRRALQLDVPRLNDLRDVKGVGVHGIDELRQCYEIKMSSGTSLPTNGTLTASEVKAANNDSDFFLAMVTDLRMAPVRCGFVSYLIRFPTSTCAFAQAGRSAAR